MPDITVQKIKDPVKQAPPIFAELEKRFDAVRQRAHELFLNRGQVDRALDDWFAAEHELFGWSAAELSEKDNAYEVDFDLAGFDAKDIQVTAMSNEIIVRAAAKETREVEKDKVLWSEFGSNDVFRRFELPEPIDTDKVTATLDKGILRIKARKGVAAEKKNIPVSSVSAAA